MLRIGTKIAVASAAFAAATVGLAAPAAAQATRTWASGVGDDANPCSRTAPCKTFAGTISKTAAGGEINCLDPGGYGAVTITKSITINCEGTLGSVLVSSTNGIIINDAGAGTIKVVLRNLEIEGLGESTASSGIRGIYFLSGASLTVEKVTIRDFKDPTNGAGITFTPSTAATLTVTNSSIIDNGASGAGAGILIQPTSTGTATAFIENTQIIGSSNVGLSVSSAGSSGGTKTVVLVKNSSVTGGAYGALALVPPSTARAIQLSISGSVISSNTGYGVAANGAGAQARLSNTVVTNNATGLLAAGSGAVLSYGGNTVYANTTDGTFTATFPQQ